jgi:hypothetical protein
VTITIFALSMGTLENRGAVCAPLGSRDREVPGGRARIRVRNTPSRTVVVNDVAVEVSLIVVGIGRMHDGPKGKAALLELFRECANDGVARVAIQFKRKLCDDPSLCATATTWRNVDRRMFSDRLRPSPECEGILRRQLQLQGGCTPRTRLS